MIELLQLSQVLDAVRSTGTEVRYYDKDCKTGGFAGYYQFSADVDRLVICPDNQRNHSDLFDTVRHEAIHVVQACNKGKPILAYDYYVTNASRETWAKIEGYPEEHKHHEIEAFHAAHHLNEKEVINLINKFCFE